MTKKEAKDLEMVVKMLEMHSNQSAYQHEELKDSIEKIGTRVSKIEDTQSRFKGALALLSFIGLGGLTTLLK